MGYTTDFEGRIEVSPALTPPEIWYLKQFAGTRRMLCEQGPYCVGRAGVAGQDDDDPHVIDYNKPPKGQPGLWCKWEPTEDGTAIVWNGIEKFYDSVEWMQYLIDHFVGPEPIAKDQLPFLQGHNLSGQIKAQGEDPDDAWILVVENDVAKRIERPHTGVKIECPCCESQFHLRDEDVVS